MMSGMKRLLPIAFAATSLVGGMAVQGCAAPADPRMQAAVDDKPFYARFTGLLDQVKADPQYKRIPLDTSEQTNEFMQWLHDAYRRKISKSEFVQRIGSRYPGHQYEANFISQRLPD
jgi:hypothetical protein